MLIKMILIISVLLFHPIIYCQTIITNIVPSKIGIKSIIIILQLNVNSNTVSNLIVKQKLNEEPYQSSTFIRINKGNEIEITTLNLLPESSYKFSFEGLNITPTESNIIKTENLLITQSIEQISPEQTRIKVQVTNKSHIDSEVFTCSYSATNNVNVFPTTNLCSDFIASHENFRSFEVEASSTFAKSSSKITVTPKQYLFHGIVKKVSTFKSTFLISDDEGNILPCNLLYLTNSDTDQIVQAFCNPVNCISKCLNDEFELINLRDATKYTLSIRSQYRQFPLSIPFETNPYPLELEIVRLDFNSFTFKFIKTDSEVPSTNCVIKIYQNNTQIRAYLQPCEDTLKVDNLPRNTVFRLDNKPSTSRLTTSYNIETLSPPPTIKHLYLQSQFLFAKIAQPVISKFPITYKLYCIRTILSTSTVLSTTNQNSNIFVNYTFTDINEAAVITLSNENTLNAFNILVCAERQDTLCKTTPTTSCGNCISNIVSSSDDPNFVVLMDSIPTIDPIDFNLEIKFIPFGSINPSIQRCYVVIGDFSSYGLLKEQYNYDPYTQQITNLNQIRFTTQAEYFLNDCLKPIHFILGDNKIHGRILNKPITLGFHYTYLFIMCDINSCKSQKPNLYSMDIFFAIYIIISILFFILFLIAYLIVLIFSILFYRRNKNTNSDSTQSMLKKQIIEDKIQETIQDPTHSSPKHSASFGTSKLHYQMNTENKIIFPDNSSPVSKFKLKAKNHEIKLKSEFSSSESSKNMSINNFPLDLHDTILNFTNIKNPSSVEFSNHNQSFSMKSLKSNNDSNKIKKSYNFESDNNEGSNYDSSTKTSKSNNIVCNKSENLKNQRGTKIDATTEPARSKTESYLNNEEKLVDNLKDKVLILKELESKSDFDSISQTLPDQALVDDSKHKISNKSHINKD